MNIPDISGIMKNVIVIEYFAKKVFGKMIIDSVKWRIKKRELKNKIQTNHEKQIYHKIERVGSVRHP